MDLALVAFALVAHQIFRKYEACPFSLHLFLLFGPPTLVKLQSGSVQWSSDSTPLQLQTPLPSLLRPYGVYLATLALSVGAYRLSPMHPLAEYPGPLGAKLSKFWHATVSMTGRQHLYVKRLHAIYGSVVRIGPNELSINDPSVITQLLGPSGMPKSRAFEGGAMSQEDLPLIGILDIDEHLNRRRSWNRGFSSAAVKGYEDLVGKRAKQLSRKLEQQQEVILGTCFDRFAYDLMYDIVFGGGSEIMRDGDENGVWTLIEKGLTFACFFAHVPWLGVYAGKVPVLAEPLRRLHAFGGQSVRERMARGSKTCDLYHYLNNEDIPDKEPPLFRHLVDDGILAIVAGTDTTTSAITSLFFLLMANPDRYAKLQGEIDKYYPRGEDAADTKHHRHMPYLHAVINEALRLFPPLATSLSRQVPRESSGVFAGSMHIPPGTTFNLPPYILQRDPRSFSLPDAFWPERWLVTAGQLKLGDADVPGRAPSALADSDSDSDFEFVHNEDAFIPFSVGPMNCVGKNLALVEMRVLVCVLLQRFAFRLREGWDPRMYEENYKDFLVAMRPPLPAVLEPRW